MASRRLMSNLLTRGRFASLLAMVLSLAVIVPVAAYPGSNGRIIFTENSTSSTALWSIRPDGSGLRVVTIVQSSASRAFVTFPSVSADGSKLAVMLIEQFEKPVTCGQVVTDTCPSVVLMDSNGTNQRVIFSDARITSRALALSPDGSRVALVLANSGRKGSGESVYLLHVNSARLSRLTKGSAVDSYPRWSPDGHTVSFDSNRDSAITGRSWSVFKVAVRGGKIGRLMPDSLGNDLYADWSPGGDRLTFVRTFSGPFEDAIYTVSRDGTDARELVRSTSTLGIPSFSPDGTDVAYTMGDQLWLMDTEGGNRRALVTGARFGFTWLPGE